MEDVNKVIKMIEQERQVSIGGLHADADLGATKASNGVFVSPRALSMC